MVQAVTAQRAKYAPVALNSDKRAPPPIFMAGMCGPVQIISPGEKELWRDVFIPRSAAGGSATICRDRAPMPPEKKHLLSHGCLARSTRKRNGAQSNGSRASTSAIYISALELNSIPINTRSCEDWPRGEWGFKDKDLLRQKDAWR